MSRDQDLRPARLNSGSAFPAGAGLLVQAECEGFWKINQPESFWAQQAGSPMALPFLSPTEKEKGLIPCHYHNLSKIPDS
jgi:hypothetical protein